MEIAAKLPQLARALFARKEARQDAALLAELADLQMQLDAARSQFDILTEDDLIDACCYQLKSLTTRYGHLLREARQKGLRRQPYAPESFQSAPKGVSWFCRDLPAERMRAMTANPYVQELADRIAALCSPEKIYIFSMKYDLRQRVTSFKLCVVADTPEKRRLEQDIYLRLDCPLPYDVVIYTAEEWAEFSADEDTFAHSIAEKGVLVYDKARQ